MGRTAIPVRDASPCCEDGRRTVVMRGTARGPNLSGALPLSCGGALCIEGKRMSSVTRIVNTTPDRVWEVLSDGWLFPL